MVWRIKTKVYVCFLEKEENRVRERLVNKRQINNRRGLERIKSNLSINPWIINVKKIKRGKI